MAKAAEHTAVRRFTDIPNVGPAMASDFELLGIAEPAELARRDPKELYDDLCERTGSRQDPCVLDTMIAVVRFMQGGPAIPWWEFTAERKATYPQV